VSESSVRYDQLSFLDHFFKDSVCACVRFSTECLRSFVILQNGLFVDEFGCEIAGTCESELIGDEFWIFWIFAFRSSSSSSSSMGAEQAGIAALHSPRYSFVSFPDCVHMLFEIKCLSGRKMWLPFTSSLSA
jgi:hypothetical protein